MNRGMSMTATETQRDITVSVPMAPSPALAPNRLGHEHWRKRQQAAQERREAAMWSCYQAQFVFSDRFSGTVAVHEHIVLPKGKRLKDEDSLATYAKPALDGICDAGIIASDGPKHVLRVTTSQAVGDDA